ncbi:MAG: response regulator [Azonexus sp.]
MAEKQMRHRLLILAFLLWTAMLGASLAWNLHNAQEQTMNMAYAEARANLNKDLTFRRWGNMHGGVYVPVTETQKSVPFLAHVPGRDVTTTDGRQLTLLNPASMLRQMMDSYADSYGIRGRITGLKYLNPGNAPDAWEKAQLESFERRERTEVWSVTDLDGKPYLRYLRAMFMEEGCNKCHAILGYKTGDMRGATGLNLPLAPYLEQLSVSRMSLSVSHALIWLLGVAGIAWAARLGVRWAAERETARLELERHRDHLESLVEERTEALTAAKNEAEAANRAKSTFLANISHEIRTPLNAITGMVHLMQRAGITPRQADQLLKIDNAGRHLLEIINAVLELSKIEAGKFVLEEAELALPALIANVVSIQQDRVHVRHLQLLTECPDLPMRLLGDPTRLQQAILNYLNNAIKFTERGSIVLRVLMLEENDAGVLLRFEVEDTGIGIAAEAIERLFSDFEQADNSTTRQYGGTGLGLSITRKIARLMDGEAGVSSTPGVGSIFWFTARLRKAGEVAARPVLAPGDSAEETLARDYAGRRILLAEDEPINQEIARQLLEEAGLIVETAEDGEQAVALAASRAYDLILMDMQMPNLDGLGATRAIRHLPGHAHTRILAMTANAFDDDRQRCFAAGMDDFIAKPVDPRVLFAVILRNLRAADGQQ